MKKLLILLSLLSPLISFATSFTLTPNVSNNSDNIYMLEFIFDNSTYVFKADGTYIVTDAEIIPNVSLTTHYAYNFPAGDYVILQDDGFNTCDDLTISQCEAVGGTFVANFTITNLLGIGTNFISDITSQASSVFYSLWPLFALLVGIPFGFYIIKKLVHLNDKK